MTIHFKSDESLQELLNKKIEAEDEIERIVRNNKFRFSKKKFVADLGEYYFYINVREIFKTLEQSEESNADFDFKGILKNDLAAEFGFPSDTEIKVEIKTRYHQKGKNQIFGLKPSKFDILAFVSLDKNYRCHYVGLIKSTDLRPDKQNRIVFTALCNEGKKLWPPNEYVEFQ